MEVMLLEDAIKNLGFNSIQIRATIYNAGVKGRQQSVCNCPVANYLKSQGYRDVVAGTDWCAVKDQEPVITPNSVKDFMEKFDAGLYPELIQ